jgi:hypothetical protein
VHDHDHYSDEAVPAYHFEHVFSAALQQAEATTKINDTGVVANNAVQVTSLLNKLQ